MQITAFNYQKMYVWMALITFLVWPPSAAALLRVKTMESPLGWWGMASQKGAAFPYSSSPFSWRSAPRKLCVDFGSSGAKFMDCTDKNNIVKYDEKFFNGAGAFARMTQTGKTGLNKLDEQLKHYLATAKMKINGFELRMCGGTAGNRFKHLMADDSKGWSLFNELLEKNGVAIPKGKKCRTLPGTEEARLEWTLSGFANIFVGIGGASMQLRVPTNAKCPELVNGTHFDGGKGASTPDDYCKLGAQGADNGQLWSFLADGTRNDAGDSKHIVGGMDEVVIKMYKKVQDQILRQIEDEGQTALNWVDSGANETVRADPMWQVMIKQMHPEGCTKIGNQRVALLSGAHRGRSEFKTLRSLSKTMPTLAAASLTDSRQTLFYFLSLVEGQYTEMATKVHDQCKSAVAQYASIIEQLSKSISDQDRGLLLNQAKNFYTKFKDIRGTPNNGFLCMSNLFHYSWITTFAGYKADGVATNCAINNFASLLNGVEVDGDWMKGALLQ